MRRRDHSPSQWKLSRDVADIVPKVGDDKLHLYFCLFIYLFIYFWSEP